MFPCDFEFGLLNSRLVAEIVEVVVNSGKVLDFTRLLLGLFSSGPLYFALLLSHFFVTFSMNQVIEALSKENVDPFVVLFGEFEYFGAVGASVIASS